MKVLTKELLSLARLCSTYACRNISGLYVSNEKIVATDSYKLVEVDISGKEYAEVVVTKDNSEGFITNLEKPIIIRAKDILDLLKWCKWRKREIWHDQFFLKNLTEKSVEIFNPFLGITKRCELMTGEFPKYEHLFERNQKTEKTIGFDVEYLREIVDVVSYTDSVYLEQSTEGDTPHTNVLHIKSDKKNYKAILMPLR